MPRFTLKILPDNKESELRGGGYKFAFFFIVVLIASINTGNNLIYLVLASLTGAVIVSWAFSWLSMQNLSAKAMLPEEIYAKEETVVEFVVRKGEGLTQAHSLTLSLKGGGSPDTHLPFVEVLKRGEQKRIQGMFKFNNRGIFTVAGVNVTCNYPFGIISKTRHFKDDRQITIYPAILQIEELLKSGAEGVYTLDSIFRGIDGGLHNIRPFLPGDDHRHMHWKASAKTDNLMVKEFSANKGLMIWIHFNNLRKGAETKVDKRVFEAGVSVAASLAYHGRSDGYQMIFSAPGIRLVPEKNFEHVSAFFNHLSQIKASGILASERPEIAGRRRHNELAIVVDPLNQDVDWGDNCIVLDKNYAIDMIRFQK